MLTHKTINVQFGNILTEEYEWQYEGLKWGHTKAKKQIKGRISHSPLLWSKKQIDSVKAS